MAQLRLPLPGRLFANGNNSQRNVGEPLHLHLVTALRLHPVSRQLPLGTKHLMCAVVPGGRQIGRAFDIGE